MDVYHRNFQVRHHEAGADGTLRPASLFDMFQDAAAEHAQLLGCGMDYLKTQALIWVLSRISVQISRMPDIGENVTVETYPSGTERLFALRQFTVRDAAGNILSRASSCWLLLSGETFRPRRIAETLQKPLPLNPDMPRHFPVPDRAAPLPPETMQITHTVRSSQIDVNGHLNNAYFAAFVHDMLGALTGVHCAPETLQIFFQHAGQIGNEIVCRGGLTDGEFRMEGRSPDGAVLYFQAQGVPGKASSSAGVGNPV